MVKLRLSEIARRLEGRLLGPDRSVCAVAPLASAGPEDISFLAHPRHRKQLESSAAGAVLVQPVDAGRVRTSAVVVDDPYLAFARVARWLNPEPPLEPGIHPSAVVDPGAQVHPEAQVGPLAVIEAQACIGPGTLVGPGCIIGAGARVGADCRLLAQVTLCRGVVLGDRVRVHPGAVIGADGFGFARGPEGWEKIPQVGGVRIGDDCEIGAGCTIDRGALEDTVLEAGVKLDNLVQVAHNVRIGAHTVIAAQTGIAGSTHIGRNCMIGGQVGCNGHLTIADGVTLTGQAMVTKSIREPGVYSSGLPAEKNRLWRRQVARFRRLDQLEDRLARLEARIEEKE